MSEDEMDQTDSDQSEEQPEILQRPHVHALVYGDPHTGKTTFARTFPTPQLVFFFDTYGKDQPYLTVAGTQVYDLEPNEWGVKRKQVFRGEELMYEIEYYHDMEVTKSGELKPRAYKNFLNRLVSISDELNAGYWATVVVDSLTFLQILARMHEKYVLNPDTRNPMQHYSGVRETVEETLMVRFGGFPTNVVVVAHTKVSEVTDDKGRVIKEIPGISAVGQLSTNMSIAFGEFYKMNIMRDGTRKLQTKPNYQWIASSNIHAPDPCEPDYEKLWVNYKGGG